MSLEEQKQKKRHCLFRDTFQFAIDESYGTLHYFALKSKPMNICGNKSIPSSNQKP